jgi:hypothetical protein
MRFIKTTWKTVQKAVFYAGICLFTGAHSPPLSAAGLGVGSRADTQDAVRETARATKRAVSGATDARVEWGLQKSRHLATKANADRALAVCVAEYPEDWQWNCRVQVAITRQTDRKIKDGLTAAIERYESELDPRADEVEAHVKGLVENPSHYQHLLLESAFGTQQTTSLDLFIATMSSMTQLKNKMNTVVTMALLGDIFQLLDDLEADVEVLESQTPHLDRRIREANNHSSINKMTALQYPPF